MVAEDDMPISLQSRQPASSQYGRRHAALVFVCRAEIEPDIAEEIARQPRERSAAGAVNMPLKCCGHGCCPQEVR